MKGTSAAPHGAEKCNAQSLIRGGLLLSRIGEVISDTVSLCAQSEPSRVSGRFHLELGSCNL